MNTVHRILRSATSSSRVRIPLAFFLAAVSGLTFWFATAPQTQAAPPPMCTVCHKRVTSITVPCFGAAYRRHKDHGDTDGAGGATTSNSFLSPLKPASKNQQPQQQ